MTINTVADAKRSLDVYFIARAQQTEICAVQRLFDHMKTDRLVGQFSDREANAIDRDTLAEAHVGPQARKRDLPRIAAVLNASDASGLFDNAGEHDFSANSAHNHIMARELREMVVAITGASAGIGRELAVQLAQNGAKLVLAARRLEMLEELNRSLGGRHATIRADVSQSLDCEAIVDRAVQSFGRIDTLVCNAGYALFRNLAEFTSEEMRAIFATNLFGTTDCIRAAVPVMSAQEPRNGYRGQIMIVSSAVARRGLPYSAGYSATKAAQLSIAEALRIELRPARIAVSSVHPIDTETDFFSTAECISRRKLHEPGTVCRRHSVERVARGMVRAIRRPKAEVWSSPPTRWGLAINALF